MEKKRILWKHTVVKVEGDVIKSTGGWWWWWKGLPKRIWWPQTQSPITYSGLRGFLSGGDNSTLPAWTQVRIESDVDLTSTSCEEEHRQCWYGTRTPSDTQSFTAAGAIKLFYSEAKKTQLFFRQNIRTRLSSYVCTDDWGAKVCLCMQRDISMGIVHTHAHARARVGRRAGADTLRWGRGCFFTQPWQCPWDCLTQQKFELFLNFSSKFESNCENLLWSVSRRD